MNSRFLNLLAQWTLILLLPVFLALLPAYIFTSDAFVTYEYGRPDITPSTRFSSAQRYYYSVEAIKFSLGQRTLDQFVGLGIWNDREIKHMIDFQRVLRGALTTHAIVGVFILIALIYLVRAKEMRKYAYGALLKGSLVTLAIVAIIGFFSAVAFDQFFVIFHSIFFVGDSWLFPVTDSLIQLYPIEFFEDVTYGIALATVGGALMVGVMAWILKRREVRKKVSAA